MERLVCIARGAIAMAITQHQMACFAHKRIFDPRIRVLAIGFCLFFATISKLGVNFGKQYLEPKSDLLILGVCVASIINITTFDYKIKPI